MGTPPPLPFYVLDVAVSTVEPRSGHLTSGDPHKRNPGRRAALILGLVALIIANILAEVTFRVLRYHELRATRQPARVRVLDAPLLRFDREIGFRYLPDRTVHQASLESGRYVRQGTIRTNNLGHISRRPYTVERADDVFRIAAIGDSFTSGTFSSQTWSDLLEDRLNTDSALRRAAGARRFEVLNFGMDGTGFQQWPSVYRHEIAAYRPDLVLVAYIENDLWRNFKWMATILPRPGAAFQIVLVSESLPVDLENPSAALANEIVIPTADAGERERSLHEALAARLRAMPWLSPRPELIGTLLTRAGWPTPPFLTPRLHFRPNQPPRHGLAVRIERAAEAARLIASSVPVVLVHLPLEREIKAGRVAEKVGDFTARVRSVPSVSLMQDLLARAQVEDSSTWFFPDNLHPTDEGVRIYAGAILDALRFHISPLLENISPP